MLPNSQECFNVQLAPDGWILDSLFRVGLCGCVDMCIFCVFANLLNLHHVFVKMNYLVTFCSLYTGCTICAAYNFMVYWDKD